MLVDTPAAIRQCPFFEEFQPRHVEKFISAGSEVRFTKDEIIFREGEDSRLFYVIVSGKVALEATLAGRKHLIQTLCAGSELGWSAPLKFERAFQARALENVHALAFDVADIDAACEGNPYFKAAFLKRMFTVVAERLQSTLQLADAMAVTKADNGI